MVILEPGIIIAAAIINAALDKSPGIDTLIWLIASDFLTLITSPISISNPRSSKIFSVWSLVCLLYAIDDKFSLPKPANINDVFTCALFVSFIKSSD